MTPSIRRKLIASLDALHADVVYVVRGKLQSYGEHPDSEAFKRRWSLPQLLGEEDDPLDA